MRSLSKIMRGLVFVGQLGVSIITPPVVLILLARWLMDRFGWGLWVMVTAILVGIITAFTSAWSTLKRLIPKNDRTSVSYNKHY